MSGKPALSAGAGRKAEDKSWKQDGKAEASQHAGRHGQQTENTNSEKTGGVKKRAPALHPGNGVAQIGNYFDRDYLLKKLTFLTPGFQRRRSLLAFFQLRPWVSTGFGAGETGARRNFLTGKIRKDWPQFGILQSCCVT